MRVKSIILFSAVAITFASCSQNGEHHVNLVKDANDSNQYKSSGNMDANTLHAFSAINSEVIESNHILNEKKEAALALFDKQAKANSKVKPFYEKALQVDTLAQKLCLYIDSINTLLISKTQNIEWGKARSMWINNSMRTENYSAITSIMIGDSIEADNGKAYELKVRLADYRKKILSFVSPEDTLSLNIGLRTPDYVDRIISERVSWEVKNFDGMPLPGVIVILSEFKNDIKGAELSVIQQLLLY